MHTFFSTDPPIDPSPQNLLLYTQFPTLLEDLGQNFIDYIDIHVIKALLGINMVKVLIRRCSWRGEQPLSNTPDISSPELPRGGCDGTQ